MATDATEQDEPVDAEHERNLKVEKMMATPGEHERLAREEEPPPNTIREGQVFESLDPREDDPRRRVRVLTEPDGDGKVQVENLSTRRKSHVAADRLLNGTDWKRSV